MALFGLLPSKSKSLPARETLVVVDWDYARRRNVSFSFLSQLTQPRLWMVFQKPAEDATWKRLKTTYPLTPYQVPTAERNLSTFLAAQTAFSLGGEHRFREIVIVGSRGMYQGLAMFLGKTLNLPVKVFGAGRENEADTPVTRSPSPAAAVKSERERKNTEKPERRPEPKRTPESRPPEDRPPVTWPEEDLRTYAQQIADFFPQTYTLGESYKKSFFGMAIKQATGKNTYLVFRTKNAGPFLGFLFDTGCIEAQETQLCLLKRYPTAEEILALALRTTQRRGPRPEPTAPSATLRSSNFSEESDEPSELMYELEDELRELSAPPAKQKPSPPKVKPTEGTESVIWDELN